MLHLTLFDFYLIFTRLTFPQMQIKVKKLDGQHSDFNVDENDTGLTVR